MKELSKELIGKIKSMGEAGHTQREIHEHTGCSLGTIRKYLREDDVDNYHIGGRISKTIPLPRNDLGEGKQVEKKPEPSVLVADQHITLVGLKSGFQYNIGMHDDTLSVEGGELLGTMDLEKIPSLAKELMEIYQTAVKMKKGV